jgi:hypothetical protein
MHPAQLASLQTDTDYEPAQRFGYMGSGGTKAPALTGMAGYYAGFAIYEDIVGIREWAESDTVPGFFGATVEKRFDDSAVSGPSSTRVRNAIVFGKGAIGKAVANDLHFTSEVDDHANTIELGGAAINGYNRADFFAETDALETSGDAFYKNQSAAQTVAAELTCVNQSSLILATLD